jgi:hypothetical protein
VARERLRTVPERRETPRVGIAARGADSAMGGEVIYLVVGLDQNTLTPWHRNVRAADVTTAKRIASARAEAHGISLLVAAVIGPDSSVVSEAARERADRRIDASVAGRPRLDPTH